MSLKESLQQIRKDLADIDEQIYELETYYFEDTKETGNIVKGFENYICAKTNRGQQPKKQKVQNYERLFSLSNSKSRVSSVLGDMIINDPSRVEPAPLAQKRNRQRMTGQQKMNGKHAASREEHHEEEDEESDDGEGAEYSLDESDKHKGIIKKKRIIKPSKKG